MLKSAFIKILLRVSAYEIWDSLFLCFLLWIIFPALILVEVLNVISPFPSCTVLYFPKAVNHSNTVCNLLCETDILPLIYVKFLSTLIQHSHFPLVIICTFLCLLDDFCLRQALLVGWTSGDTTLAYRVLLCDSSLLNSPVLLQSHFHRKQNTLKIIFFLSLFPSY